MKLDYYLLSVVALLCICQFGFSDTQQIVGSENAANVGRDLDLYFLDDEDSREPLNTHHVSKREAVPSRKAPKKKKESASPAESLMGSGDSEDSDDTEDSSKVFTPPSDDEDGEDIDGSGDIFSFKPKTAKKPRVSTPPPIRGENSRPSANTPSSTTTTSTTTTTTSTAMPTTTSTTTEEPSTSTAASTTMRTTITRRPSPSGPSMPEDDEDSEDDGDYEGSGAGESPIVKGHVNVPKKPHGANRESTSKPKTGDASILHPTDYSDIDDDGDFDGDDDDDEEDSDDDFSFSTPKSLAPSSTVEPSTTTSTTTPPPTTTTSSTTTEISTSTPAAEIPKSTSPASVPGVDDDSVGGDDDEDEDDDTDVDDNEDTDDVLRKTQDKHNKNENNNNGVDNSNENYSNNNANTNVNNNNKANKEPPKIEDNSEDNDIVHDKEEDNLIPGGTSREVHLSRHKATQRPSTLLGQPGILVAIMGGAVVGLLLAILCVMFVVYRMRKKDEGSFPLGKRTHDDHFSTHRRHYMRPSANKEFYA